MNLKKINKLIVDTVMTKDNKLRVGKNEEVVAVVPDGFCLFLIKHKDFIFNYDKLEKDSPFDFRSCIKSKSETSAVKVTGDIKVLKDKRKIVKVANDNEYTFVNEKYLSYFSKECKFRIDETAKLSPLYVFNGEDFVGMVMAYDLEKRNGK